MVQGGACAVDKAAAINADAGGVGHHHFGAAAGDFDIAVQPARVAAVDLVDDDACFAAGEKGVALYPAGLAGGYVRRRQLLPELAAAFAPPQCRKLYQLLHKFIPI